MNKTTIYLPVDLQRSLQSAALRSGRSQAHLIREAVERFLEDDRPMPKSIGIGEDTELDARDSKHWLRDEWSKLDHP